MGNETVTKIELEMVKTAPLAFELQAVGDALVKLIKKAPLELQPAALAAALETVAGLQAAADAAVEQLQLPPHLSTSLVNRQGELLAQYIREQVAS